MPVALNVIESAEAALADIRKSRAAIVSKGGAIPAELAAAEAALIEQVAKAEAGVLADALVRLRDDLPPECLSAVATALSVPGLTRDHRLMLVKAAERTATIRRATQAWSRAEQDGISRIGWMN